MRIDIDQLSEAELIDLNNRIVARLPFLQQMRAHVEHDSDRRAPRQVTRVLICELAPAIDHLGRVAESPAQRLLPDPRRRADLNRTGCCRREHQHRL